MIKHVHQANNLTMPDAGLRPPSGGAWAPSSVKALVQRAEGLGLA